MDKNILIYLKKKSGATTPAELYQYVIKLADELKQDSIRYVMHGKRETFAEAPYESEILKAAV